MKMKLAAGLMRKMTWSVHYHLLNFECLCLLTTYWLILRIDWSAHCVIKSCFYLLLFHFCTCATVAALEKMYSRWVTDPLFVY